ncbi:MAG: hypothetical protein WC477_03945 [Patescibacteria group bacterium]
MENLDQNAVKIEKKRYSGWRRFFEIMIGILLAAIAAELFLQISDRGSRGEFFNDQNTGLLLYKPHTSFIETSDCYTNTVTINNAGFYAQDIAKEKNPNTYRIAVVGSSFAESRSVSLSQHFATLLSQRLNANAAPNKTFEVIPFGFAGNGTYLDMLYYDTYVAPYHPDLVIDLITDYEFGEDSPNSAHPPQFDANGKVILDLPQTQNSPVAVFAKNILRNSKLIASIYGRLMILRSNMHPKTDPNAVNASSTTQNAESATDALWKTQDALWRTQNALLSQFKDLARANNSRFLLVSWSRVLDHLPAPFTSHIQEIAQTHSIPYLDLDPIFAKQYAKEHVSPIWSCGGHWNTVGNAWTANAIYDELKAQPDLIP